MAGDGLSLGMRCVFLGHPQLLPRQRHAKPSPAVSSFVRPGPAGRRIFSQELEFILRPPRRTAMTAVTYRKLKRAMNLLCDTHDALATAWGEENDADKKSDISDARHEVSDVLDSVQKLVRKGE